MIVFGQPIADNLYTKLEKRVVTLKKKLKPPTLKIILIGNNPRSITYVRNKKLHGEKHGISVLVNHLNENISGGQLKSIVSNYNNDPKINGIIIQLPLPKTLNESDAVAFVSQTKDVDGFLKESQFTNPLANAVLLVLKKQDFKFENKKICVIGKGKTAGLPIFNELKKYSSNIVQVDSKTNNKNEIILSSDVVITCVGKKGVVNKTNCKKGAILINCGLHIESGKLKADYEEDEIKNIALSYTPTPGGVGPVNVACLLANTVLACENQNKI